MCHKKPLNFKITKNCFEAAQIERKTGYLEKNKFDVDSLKEDPKEFVKNNNLILKTKRRFKSERHNVFIKEISIDVIETYAYGTSKI